jgi:hypothetical protein
MTDKQVDPRLAWFRATLRKHPSILAAWVLALTIFGRLVIPWEKPRLTDEAIARCEAVLKPGDIIGVESARFVTGHVLPKGKYGVEHSAIYVGGGKVIEAVTPCTREIDFRQFAKAYDRIVVGKPREPYDRSKACEMARSLTGRPYDTLFDEGTGEVYCHETCATCMKAGGIPLVRDREFWEFDTLASGFGSLQEFPQ